MGIKSMSLAGGPFAPVTLHYFKSRNRVTGRFFQQALKSGGKMPFNDLYVNSLVRPFANINGKFHFAFQLTHIACRSYCP
jgi:hypothetical protein